MTQSVTERRFPPPWSVEELEACFVGRDHSGQKLAYVYFEDEPGPRSATKLLTKDAADCGEYRQAAGASAQGLNQLVTKNREFRDRYHRTNRQIMQRQQSRRAWATTDGFAFVSHAGAVISGRHPLGAGSRKSPHEKRHSRPDSESYLPNSAILLDASRAGAWPHGFWEKRRLGQISPSRRELLQALSGPFTCP